MKAMPYEIKQKLRQLAKAHQKASDLENEAIDMIEEYDVDCSYLNATCDVYSKTPYTEALAYITNSEGSTEDSISQIEEVFLWHVNNREED